LGFPRAGCRAITADAGLWFQISYERSHEIRLSDSEERDPKSDEDDGQLFMGLLSMLSDCIVTHN
jgi:hypothetical protein